MTLTHPVSTDLLSQYLLTLNNKAAGTADAYSRILRQFTTWLVERPGNGEQFQPVHLTQTAVESYLASLASEGYSASHQTLVKAAISNFAHWLMEDQGLLRRNPTRGIQIASQPLLAPRILNPDQRYVLRNLVERSQDVRGAAIFALGYWAGCRVSDVSWLKRADTHVGPRSGWLTVGHKGGKQRKIDLLAKASGALYEYLQQGGRGLESLYTFTSQRAERLSEAGIHHWFRDLKAQATKDEWDLIHDVTFHDLRHDFAHRAREAGWQLEEVAYYLGHITRKGTPALQTTIRYTQASREQIKNKLSLIMG